MSQQPPSPARVGIDPGVAGFLIDQLAQANASLGARVAELEQQLTHGNGHQGTEGRVPAPAATGGE